METKILETQPQFKQEKMISSFIEQLQCILQKVNNKSSVKELTQAQEEIDLLFSRDIYTKGELNLSVFQKDILSRKYSSELNSFLEKITILYIQEKGNTIVRKSLSEMITSSIVKIAEELSVLYPALGSFNRDNIALTMDFSRFFYFTMITIFSLTNENMMSVEDKSLLFRSTLLPKVRLILKKLLIEGALHHFKVFIDSGISTEKERMLHKTV